MQKRTMSAVGETKRKELDKLIMLGEMRDREIANELSIDCGLVISRRRTLRNRKNFDQKCEKLRRKIAAEMVQQPVEEKKELINVENQIPEPETEPVPRQRKTRIRMTDELKEAIAKAYKETKSLSDVAKLFNCSESSVIRVATQFGLYTPLRITLTDDLKMKIAESYEATKSFSETAKEIKCSETTVRRVAEEFNLYTPKHYRPYKETTEETEDSAVVKSAVKAVIREAEEEDFYEIDFGNHVICTMFADRHDVPKDCKLSIFETTSLEGNKVLDFGYIDTKVQQFILNHIFSPTGEPDKDLVVYVSGLQSVLGSICKQCLAMNVGLTLMHYDPLNGRWFSQVIIPNKTSGIYNSKLAKLGEFDHVLVSKNIDPATLGDEGFYAVVKTTYKDADQTKDESFCYICTDEVAGFDTFRDISIDIRNHPNICTSGIDIRKHPETYASVYLYQVSARSGSLWFSASIAKSYNFKKN